MFYNRTVNDIEITFSQQVRFNLQLVEETTHYTVSLTENEDGFVFQNEKMETDTMTFLFNQINIEPNNDPKEKSVVFHLPDVTNLIFSVIFSRPNMAKRFRDFQVIGRIIARYFLIRLSLVA